MINKDSTKNILKELRDAFPRNMKDDYDSGYVQALEDVEWKLDKAE